MFDRLKKQINTRDITAIAIVSTDYEHTDRFTENHRNIFNRHTYFYCFYLKYQYKCYSRINLDS